MHAYLVEKGSLLSRIRRQRGEVAWTCMCMCMYMYVHVHVHVMSHDMYVCRQLPVSHHSYTVPSPRRPTGTAPRRPTRDRDIEMADPRKRGDAGLRVPQAAFKPI